MKKSIAVFLTATITFLLTIVAAALIFLLGLLATPDDSADILASKVRILNNLISSRSIKDFDEKQAVENALYAYVATLDDQYAQYFEKDYYSEYVND